MSPAAKTYYPYLDKLRVFLTCLVIFHHTAIAFGASGGWYYKSPDLWSGWSERLMSLVMGIDQSYFMALFFRHPVHNVNSFGFALLNVKEIIKQGI